MTTAGVQRFVVALLVAVAVWPAAHRALVDHMEMDAWELFGWSMYALPSGHLEVRVDQLYEGRPVRVRLSPPARERIARFRQRRRILGRFVPIDALARDVLALEPSMEGLEVVLRRWQLDRETARWTAEEERYAFER